MAVHKTAVNSHSQIYHLADLFKYQKFYKLSSTSYIQNVCISFVTEIQSLVE